jgi:peptide/nickel transport system substrate-binding protein
MNTLARILIIFLCIISTFSLSACSLLESQAQQVPQLVQAILSDPKTFNYALSQESPNIFGLTYVGLLDDNPITAELTPELAESWEISPDKLKITFKLKPDLKWSDGQPLTVDDVIFTYNQIYLNNEIPVPVRDVLRVGQSGALPTVKKVGVDRVEFSIPETFAPFLSSACALPILPAHVLRPTITEKDSKGKPKFLSTWRTDTPPNQLIVNGRYKLKSYVTGQRIIFEANPYYWKKDPQGNQLPHIKQVVWAIVESTDTASLQFRSGSLDAITVSPDYFSLLKKEEKRNNFTIYNGGPAYGTTFISFNLNQGSRQGKPLIDPVKSRWFNNQKFRQAVAYAIDRPRMVNNIFRGLGELQNSDISFQSPYYNQNVKSYDYNPNQAKQILLEAGFKYNETGELFDDQGNRVNFNLTTNAGNKIREAMAEQVKEDLEKIGMKIDYNPLAFSLLLDKTDNSLDWECMLLGITGSNEPNGGATIWSTQGSLHFFNQKPQQGIEPIDNQVFADWEKQMEQLFIEGARELDLEKRKEIYHKTQQIGAEYLPFIFLVNPYSLGAVRNTIGPIEFSALGGAFWNIEELKIESKISS